MGLLEVVAGDLLELGRAVAVDAVGPLHEALVERRARTLRAARRRRCPGSGCGRSGRGRPPRGGRTAFCVSSSRRRSTWSRTNSSTSSVHGGLLEEVADHRRGVDHRALLALEAVEPGRQERLDRRRHPVRLELARAPDAVLEQQEPVVDHHREQLLDEERISLGGLDDPCLRVVGDLGAAEQVVDDLARSRRPRAATAPGARAAPTPDASRGRPAARRRAEAPGRPPPSLRRGRRGRAARARPSGDPRRRARAAGGATTSRRACAPPRTPPEAGTAAPRGRRRRRAARTPPRSPPRGARPSLARAPARSSSSLDSRRLPQGLDERPERDPVAVRQAAAPDDERVLGGGFADVVDEPRLADAGVACDEHARAGARLDHAPERCRRPAPSRARARRAVAARPRSTRRSCTSRSRNAGTRSAFPFSSSGSTGSTSTWSRTSR